MDTWINSLCDSMARYLGQTVTVFTTSGGLSGSGFTGVLISIDCNFIRLLADVGAPPACPIGSACTGGYGSYGGCVAGQDAFGYSSPLGAICVIPTRAVAAFTHNAI